MSILLRVEGAMVATLAIGGYSLFGSSWWLFVVLFFVPDISMLAYLKGPKIGAICYNAAHLYVLPLMIWAAGWWSGSKLTVSIGLIWIFHIAIDRALGYGLKFFSAFQDTHLGRIGKNA
ncbi:DUF4260 domain-containing protein [Phyllobacterium myrsinacearum]|uniref:DUF4260 domain-containing protein n=1 Tax=Phyllobacterium myrsinacearum TaxID=28101 RepID=A0A839EE13_9HYPH|nr:DUF4260 domain-containing protein [Phyllobacterium myrsinacearum]MBA8877162.1 hypothetical protein [Phyllobacterium myrsinacearum]